MHQCIDTVLSAHEPLAQLPWWLCGQSMGGGLALLMAHRAWRRRQSMLDLQKAQQTSETDGAEFYAQFNGCLAICPLVKGPKPKPAPVMFVMRRVAAMLWLRCMPSFLDPPMENSTIWKASVWFVSGL